MPARRLPRPLPLDRIGQVLLDVERATDRASRIEKDPVSLLHGLSSPEDQELAGLAVSGLAFGNAGVVVRKGRELLARAGTPLATRADDPKALAKALSGFRHRLYAGEDLAALLCGARAKQRQHGSLGGWFAGLLATEGSMRGALTAFVEGIREGGLGRLRGRGARHLLPDPAGTSASKRLFLYLRWMVRPADGIDLGLWRGVSPAALLVPVDVHLSRLSRNVGLTDRKGATFAIAEEVTAKLRQLDPSDPVRFDFPLCHLGMAQGCPSKRDVVGCEGCGVRPICRHWLPAAGRVTKSPAG